MDVLPCPGGERRGKVFGVGGRGDEGYGGVGGVDGVVKGCKAFGVGGAVKEIFIADFDVGDGEGVGESEGGSEGSSFCCCWT